MPCFAGYTCTMSQIYPCLPYKERHNKEQQKGNATHPKLSASTAALKGPWSCRAVIATHQYAAALVRHLAAWQDQLASNNPPACAGCLGKGQLLALSAKGSGNCSSRQSRRSHHIKTGREMDTKQARARAWACATYHGCDQRHMRTARNTNGFWL